MPQTVIARPKAQDGREAELRTSMRGRIISTRAEKGCLASDLHHSDGNASLFIVTGPRDSRSPWKDPTRSSHPASFEEKQQDVAPCWALCVGQKAEITVVVEEARP